MRLFSTRSPTTTVGWRRNCAQGLAQGDVDRVRATGADVGLADQCVAALRWTAHDDKLLDFYLRGTDTAAAMLYVRVSTTTAKYSTEPFKPTGTPIDMWSNGTLTPSRVFDAGFARGFLDHNALPVDVPNPTQLKHQTESCLSLVGSLSLCAATGLIQGYLAYQARNTVGDYHPESATDDKPEGPDRSQAESAIDNRFQRWSAEWTIDRYIPGSAHIATMDCNTNGCTSRGRFSFNRLGNNLTIEFSADFDTVGEDHYRLGRVCYYDTTAATQDCRE
jgi:hypothetical protein